MVEENRELRQSGGKSLFEGLKSIVPPRNTELPEADTGDGKGTLEERLESGRKPSDVQIVLKQLFPDLDFKWLNNLQMSRVMPEYYVPLKRILVKFLVRTKRMPVAEAISTVEVAVGIPFEGEGRIDAIQVMGKASETELEKTKKELGLAA